MRKEVHFFERDKVYRLGLGFYFAHFPLRRSVQRASGVAVTGEATPDYLSSRSAAERVASDLPACRFVVVLRDPLERAVSHYHHRVRAKLEPRPIDQALTEALGSSDNPGTAAGDEHLYLERGLYARHLSWWYDLVGDDRMLVVGMEELVDDPSSTIATICQFIGVDAVNENHRLLHVNRGGGERPSPDVERVLREYFAEPNHDLATLLRHHQPGRSLPRWLIDACAFPDI